MSRFTSKMLLFVVVLCTAIAPAVLGSDGDEAAIRKVHADFAAAWNRHDAAALASDWTPTADLINPEGRWTKGKAELQKNFAEEQAGIFKSSTFTSTVQSVRIVNPQMAIVDAAFEIQNATPPDSAPMTQKGLYKAVMVKESGKWRTASVMAMVPVATPAPTAHH
jgi:uncharacterized protein (TIGR02246 family)